MGESFVKLAHDVLHVDDQYVADSIDGFTWWPSDLATRVSTDMGVFRHSQCVYRITAETDMLKGRGHLQQLAEALEHEMDHCTFSGPVYDEKADTIRLFCCVYATDEDSDWLKKTFAAAVAMQATEAYDMVQRLSQRFHATRACSEHPKSGIRSDHDPMVDRAVSFFHPSGDGPSRWIGDEGWKRAGWIMEREARHLDSDEHSRLAADFDWSCSEGTMHLEVRTDEPHPKLGNGLHCTLTVPMPLNTAAIGHLVIDLNTHEKTEYKRCHSLGSWCEHDGKLAFRMFMPNALYDPAVLEAVCVNMATRAIWTEEWFCDLKARAGR
ncbi:MAG: hypothetical protein KIT11_00975 [Fimbriimonadaceae bacterium]|nr:hypothetical protein [Fimbriimonadaceae bacterium]QYK55054.1 MAG: hypothetical protein KF733_08560 [Fimbriimonadaceae bacterium]